MGVYHFMGLGKSPGAVISAISYLADRYDRWNRSDEDFFSGSGSSKAGERTKHGDIQAIVLFTTSEIIDSRYDGLSYDYVDNQPGQKTGDKKRGNFLPKILRQFLAPELKRVTGSRREVSVYWCEIDRADPYLTFERIARVAYAAAAPGETGKEVWVNLTGGNNVVNLALQLAPSLVSRPPRIYYLLSDDDRCLRHTITKSNLGNEERDKFWVELPVIYLRLDGVAGLILDILEKSSVPLADDELLTRLKNHPTYWSETSEIDIQYLRRAYLNRMAGAQLIKQLPDQKHVVTVGPQWEKVLKRYYSVISDLTRPNSDAERSLGELKKRAWFREEPYLF